jgi:broad specificity phosphatase PhoE
VVHSSKTLNEPIKVEKAQTVVNPGLLWLVRHGETDWSLSGQHTGTTDLPLTVAGDRQAKEIGCLQQPHDFALVLTSPLRRARDTCRLAGYEGRATVDSNLREWDYGVYEGLTTEAIQKDRPGWSLWRNGVPGGECLTQVAARAEAVIERALSASGNTLVFAHGHVLRILVCCWLGLPPEAGQLFALSTATVTILGYERETRVITRLSGGQDK